MTLTEVLRDAASHGSAAPNACEEIAAACIDVVGRAEKAIELAVQYGGIDGAHHKSWVIDQMVRVLAGCDIGGENEEYKQIIADACAGEDGPATYTWDGGTPP